MKDLFKDKRFVFFSSGLIIFVVIAGLALSYLSSERKDLNILKEQRNEMISLQAEFLNLKKRIDAVESKRNLSNIHGVMQAIDEVFLSIGLKDKLKTVKSSGSKETKDGFEEEADLFIEKVTMNEIVNIFYKIDNAPMILTIKKAAIKKSFENPELLNITLTLSFLKSK